MIGARPFLIAYNIYLNSDEAEIADQIARDVRFISGGLRFVQAKGFLVDGQAQVSMNLTNFAKTPIHRVQEMVRREAARYGLSITKAELIGMIPQTALIDAAKYYLQLNEMEDGQVLELRLQEEEDDNGSVTPFEFVEATAAAKPTPGGGSVAALAGALAAALAQMVAGLTVGRAKVRRSWTRRRRRSCSQAERTARSVDARDWRRCGRFRGGDGRLPRQESARMTGKRRLRRQRLKRRECRCSWRH